jgi:sialate O-acetylesterase
MPGLRFPIIALLVCLAAGSAAAMAEVTLAPLFCDHAILQRNQPVPVWGRAEPGEHLTVTFRGQSVGTTAEADGRWIVYLAPMSAAIEPADLVVTGSSTLTVRDVLVGEVWLASGQSNMNRPLSSLPDAAKVVAGIRNPLIRHLNVALTAAAEPAMTVATSGWLAAEPDTAGSFSAVAWYFSVELQRKLGVPVGVIHSSWGGSKIEAWIDAPSLSATPPWPAINERWQYMVTSYPKIEAEYAAWDKFMKERLAQGQPAPETMPLLPRGHGSPHALSQLFNGMIAPLQPYALRGAFWYQGESNWERANEYAELLPAMIKAWRAQWGQGDFPFYFVQLPNYTQGYDPSNLTWAWLREAQTEALKLPNTGMAVTIDCGDPKDIHPQNKPTVGRRLGAVALSQAYGVPVDWSGPRFAGVTREGATLRVKFTHADTGLISADLPPQSFEIAGEDRKFYSATARIDGDTVIVRSDAVPAPVAVRYAWSNTPKANLFNGAGLPAAPFRSDSW